MARFKPWVDKTGNLIENFGYHMHRFLDFLRKQQESELGYIHYLLDMRSIELFAFKRGSLVAVSAKAQGAKNRCSGGCGCECDQEGWSYHGSSLTESLKEMRMYEEIKPGEMKVAYMAIEQGVANVLETWLARNYRTDVIIKSVANGYLCLLSFAFSTGPRCEIRVWRDKLLDAVTVANDTALKTMSEIKQ